MKLVQTKDEIIGNLLTLERYRQSEAIAEQGLYRDYQRRGICFVVYRQGNAVFFGPSRFIGYSHNTFKRHAKNNNKSGSVTNAAIQKVLGGKFVENPKLEAAFKQYCQAEGIVLPQSGSFGGKRKFLDTERQLVLNSETTLGADILGIAKGKGTPTEKSMLVSARLGQGAFRAGVLKIWKGCAVTGCTNDSLLRASHIKPWSKASNEERLNPYNGLMLTPNFDLLFDRGLISFQDSGKILISKLLSKKDISTFGLSKKMRIAVPAKSEQYLDYHRNTIFQE